MAPLAHGEARDGKMNARECVPLRRAAVEPFQTAVTYDRRPRGIVEHHAIERAFPRIAALRERQLACAGL